MPAPPPVNSNRAVVAVIIIGLVGALVTWALAPYLLGLFLLAMLAAAVTITIVENKRRSTRCQHCGYDLRGVPLQTRNTMKCPECGNLVFPPPPTSVDPPRPPSPDCCRVCGYDMTGLAQGSKCPECGKRDIVVSHDRK